MQHIFRIVKRLTLYLTVYEYLETRAVEWLDKTSGGN